MLDASRLLVVEDDPQDVELIRLALNFHPFTTLLDIVEDGEKALHYLLGEDDRSSTRPLPRMVLLDLRLPKIDGLQVLKTIRQHPRTHHLVVVVMTASSANQDLETCYRLGVNSYVMKPFDPQEFQQVSQKIGIYWMMLNQPDYL